MLLLVCYTKILPNMTYYVFGGTLNLAQPNPTQNLPVLNCGWVPANIGCLCVIKIPNGSAFCGNEAVK